MRDVLKIAITGATAFVLASAPLQAETPKVRATAIEHVTLLPMTSTGARIEDATLVIENGRISAVGPSNQTPIPSGAKRINGSGKWLMPTLSDCHVHVENDRTLRLLMRDPSLPTGTIDEADLFAVYVANGVLQIANLAAMSEAIGQRNNVESGKILGPHMMLAAMVDGAQPIWPIGFTRAAANADAGRQVVRDIKAEGYDQVKVYSKLNLETFSAIVDEARQQNLKVVGHIPGRGDNVIEKYFQPGYNMVAHAEEFAFQSKDMSDEDIARYVTLAKNNGTWLTATLIVDQRILEQTRDPSMLKRLPEARYVHPADLVGWYQVNPYTGRNSPERLAMFERIIAFNRKVVAAFVKAGIPVLPGTDSFLPGIVAGFGLHDELELMAQAGMSNDQVLQSTTRQAAEWVGALSDRGTLEVGKRADLLLLSADPLADVANTRKIAAVFASGQYLPDTALKAMLEKVAAKYAAMPVHAPGKGAQAGSGHFDFFPDEE